MTCVCVCVLKDCSLWLYIRCSDQSDPDFGANSSDASSPSKGNQIKHVKVTRGHKALMIFFSIHLSPALCAQLLFFFPTYILIQKIWNI